MKLNELFNNWVFRWLKLKKNMNELAVKKWKDEKIQWNVLKLYFIQVAKIQWK